MNDMTISDIHECLEDINSPIVHHFARRFYESASALIDGGTGSETDRMQQALVFAHWSRRFIGTAASYEMVGRLSDDDRNCVVALYQMMTSMLPESVRAAYQYTGLVEGEGTKQPAPKGIGGKLRKRLDKFLARHLKNMQRKYQQLAAQ